MDFGTGHLSQDPGPCIQLDVKEQLETKKQNEREDRALKYKARILQRAREVEQKSTEHEKNVLRTTLYDINARTPYLSSLTSTVVSSSVQQPPVTRRVKRKQQDSFKSLRQAQSLPQLVTGHSKSRKSSDTIAHVSCISMPALPFRRQERGHYQEELPKLHTSLRGSVSTPDILLQMERDKAVKIKTKNKIRKSQHIGHSLTKLYAARNLRSHPAEPPKMELAPMNSMQRAHAILQASMAYAAHISLDDNNSMDTDDWSMNANVDTSVLNSTYV